jgi:N-acetylglucosaminyl-diphospho-decaprenol L-rhamnosyltransferase
MTLGPESGDRGEFIRRQRNAAIERMISLSIVSHNQKELIGPLLNDIQRFCSTHALQIIITHNVPEGNPFQTQGFPFPLQVIENRRPQGFGANHNQAFRRTSGDFFCVLNPDLRLPRDPFGSLCQLLSGDREIGVAAPAVQTTALEPADNARFFPTPARIIKRILTRGTRLDYPVDQTPRYVDWLAGLFLLFPSPLFAAMNGFDEKFHLYYEDVDICARLRLKGYRVILDPRVQIIHQARRHSHRKLGYLQWHLVSMFRFFHSDVYSALRRRGL